MKGLVGPQVAVCAWGIDGAWGYGVHQNIELGPLQGQGFGEGFYASLRRRGSDQARRTFEVECGGDIDDLPTTLLDHAQSYSLAAIERPIQCGVNDGMPSLRGQLTR